MAEAVIVPPTATVRQGEVIDSSPGIEQVQAIFDRVIPAIKTEPTKKSPPHEPAKSAEPAKPVEQPPAEPVKPLEKAPEKIADDGHKLPSFLEDALRVEPVKPAATVEDDWPEELPEFKDKKETSERYKRWRSAYNQQKEELKTMKSRPAQDEASLAKIQTLESQNKQMGEVLSRMGVETHQEFQQNVIRPMYENWNRAVSIVKETGGNPDELAKAISLNGKAQFEALDAVMDGMPETAKGEVREALRYFRHYSELRQKAISEAPKTMEALHKKDLERQYEVLNQQRGEMKKLFEAAGKQLRDAKIEVLLKSNSPDTKWWDDQADQIAQNAEQLYMENTDLGKMALAAWLAPMADSYRKLWLSERAAHGKTKKMVSEKFGAEPSLSDSAGGDRNSTSEAQLQDDLKKPFKDVFLREFHRAQSNNR